MAFLYRRSTRVCCIGEPEFGLDRFLRDVLDGTLPCWAICILCRHSLAFLFCFKYFAEGISHRVVSCNLLRFTSSLELPVGHSWRFRRKSLLILLLYALSSLRNLSFPFLLLDLFLQAIMFLFLVLYPLSVGWNLKLPKGLRSTLTVSLARL